MLTHTKIDTQEFCMVQNGIGEPIGEKNMKKKSYISEVDTSSIGPALARLAKKAMLSLAPHGDGCCKRELFMSPFFPGSVTDTNGKTFKQKRGERNGIQVSVSAYLYDEKLLKSEPLSGGVVEFSKSCVVADFGYALRMLKAGEKVAREGWNGKGLKLELQVPDAHSKMTLPYIFMNYPSTPASETAPANHINARVPWLASQTDILAEDWMVVE